jgi:DNA polymerase-3 subunit alpha
MNEAMNINQTTNTTQGTNMNQMTSMPQEKHTNPTEQENNQLKFTHLHVHTEYSLLDGSSKIKELIKQTKALGMDSIAITDHGVMFGIMEFYKEAKAQGVKPIIGCEVYVASRSRFDKEGKVDANNYHLVLLAENQVGYQNLMKLVSFGFTQGFYYKPRIDLELLEAHSEGIIGSSACLGGQVQSELLMDNYEEAKKVAKRYENILGKGNFYLELQNHGYEEQKQVNKGLIQLSDETGIPLILTNDVHYTFEEDAKAHDILLCIQTNRKVSDEERMRYLGGQFFLKSPQQMASLFDEKIVKKAMENTVAIADRCHVEFEFGVTKLPKFDLPEGKSASEYLRELCEIGLKERYREPTSEHRERLDYELGVIETMGFVDYFLIVWDFIKYAKDHDIIVGPGRGSAAGSIVAYSLKITDIDPLKYSLIFERFLNPERVTMPDIDIDFCYENRQKVIDYVVEKYGDDKVAQIITFGTMAARAVIRDVGRALDLPYGLVDKVAKMIPQELKITIDKALKTNPDLKKLYDNDEQIKYLIDMSMRLEGLHRHSSTHAAGVVICEKPVYEYVPLNVNDEAITTQFDMTTLEALGLLKMDFLGLRTLTVIQNAVKQIKHNRGIDVDMGTIDYNDEAVYELIGSGKTEGVFQLESEGMKNFMKELKPQNIEDIIAGISLYRPGPMDFIPSYIKGKKNPELITYDCDELITILEPTYGCIVYQEQVMQIVRDLAGYTLGRSDLVRRAMSKKKADVMQQEKKNFIFGNEEQGVPGCIAKGISEKAATKIFDDMTSFAQYAFNKSHAAAYAVIAYQTAWLKTHYKVEFMAALLSSVMGNSSKVAEYIATLKGMEIKLLPPDVNEGYSHFSVSKESIRFSLAALKNVGKSAIENMVLERSENGNFVSLTDFCTRMHAKGVNKRMLESMIKAGAFDSLGGNRRQYMQAYKIILDATVHGKKNVISGQMDIFSLGEDPNLSMEDILEEIDEFPNEILLANEKEVLSVYLSGHPLEKYEALWKRKISNKSYDFSYIDENGNHRLIEGQTVIIGGIITEKVVKIVKSNQPMAFIMVEDLYGVVEVIIFPRDYEKYKEILVEDAKVFIKGRVSIQEEQAAKLICMGIVPFEKINKPKVKIVFENLEEYKRKESELFTAINNNSGNARIIIELRAENSKKILEDSQSIDTGETTKAILESIVGKGNINIE